MTTVPATVFVPTRWTLVLAARGETPEAKAALGELCEAYWTPVFRFLLREGRGEDAARELTQEFFARVLARDAFARVDPGRGRFRSFLLGALKHFLVDTRKHAQRLKRGGDQSIESLDAPISDTSPGIAADPVAPVDALPDAHFDRQWALTIMERALTVLEREFVAADRALHFAALKPWLVGDAPTPSQAKVAVELGLSEGALKVAIHRLRKRFRELVRTEVAATVPDANDVEEELRYLVDVLAQG